MFRKHVLENGIVPRCRKPLKNKPVNAFPENHLKEVKNFKE